MDIMIRSRVKTTDGSKTYTEWSEIVHSWKKAWSIVRSSKCEKDAVKKWKITEGFAYLDITQEN